MFQSQAGFVPLCDLSQAQPTRDEMLGFNPRRDLFLFATALWLLDRRIQQMFQSQAGFVPLCDVDRLAAPVCVHSFNPRRDLFLFATPQQLY